MGIAIGKTPVRLAGGVKVERSFYGKPHAFLNMDRGLKSGYLDHIPLTEDDLTLLVVSSVKALRALREDDN